MKNYIAFILVSLMSATSFASEEYCQASQTTVEKIEVLRISEIHYRLVQAQTVQALLSDSCVESRLSLEEIYTLSEILLSFNNSQDTADELIREFLAQ